MSTVELISAKVSQLSEQQAQEVLSYVERLSSGAAPTAQEVRRMPPVQRSRLLARQAAEAERDYRSDSDPFMDLCDPPLDYGASEPR